MGHFILFKVLMDDNVLFLAAVHQFTVHNPFFFLQDPLMDYILQSESSLLQDGDFRSHMSVCQEAMETLQTELQQLSDWLDYHQALVAIPRELAKLAAALYQALQEVSRLSPAYSFSLRDFTRLMQEAFAVTGRPLVSHPDGTEPGGMVAEITNKMVSQLLAHYRPCLLKSHVTVLKLLVSLALLQHRQQCSEGERAAFLRGLEGAQPPCPATQSTSSLPGWIPPHIHPDLLCLEKVLAFRGLISSLSSCPAQWQEYLRSSSSSVLEPVPCPSHSQLSLLQRAVLWRTMLPDRLADVTAACCLRLPELTVASEAPHAGNPKPLLRYLVKYQGPIVLVFPSPREDTWTSVQPLSLINNLADCAAGTKKATHTHLS